jgi:hypothetical protein
LVTEDHFGVAVSGRVEEPAMQEGRGDGWQQRALRGEHGNAVCLDLFLPFTRLADRTTQDGSGLGLALVASIAAQHGGTVDAEAQTTGGLTVTVRLPVRAAQPAEAGSSHQTINP